MCGGETKLCLHGALKGPRSAGPAWELALRAEEGLPEPGRGILSIPSTTGLVLAGGVRVRRGSHRELSVLATHGLLFPSAFQPLVSVIPRAPFTSHLLLEAGGRPVDVSGAGGKARRGMHS